MAYLIDGHNLIPHVRGLSLSDLDDEAALIELLKQFGQQRQKNIEVYFDGAPPGFARQRRFGRVTAHFVPRASSADAAIEQRLVALGRGAAVSISRSGWSPAVAEMALALILNLLRRVSDYHAAMREGRERWVVDFPGDIDPAERELTGRSVGIVGFGGVGRRLAELLRPFATTLRIVDPYVSRDAILAAGARQASLDELVRESDVVVLAAACSSETRHLLGRREIEALRPNAVLVNVARAALVDTAALTDRLRRGDLFAAVDVFDREPLDRADPLRALPNAYLTPHRAGGISASVVRVLGDLVEDLEAFSEERPRKRTLREEMIAGLDG
jgi:phosphoglycerate dehydrogenase-like enzyme